MTKDENLESLQYRRHVMQQYLQMKVNEEDWHGVQDAASDLRDIDSEIKGLSYQFLPAT